MLAAPRHAQVLDPGDLGGEADAAGAVDAAGHDGLDQRPQILVLDRSLRFRKARAVAAVGHRLVLQVAFAALVADRTIQRVVDEQEFHHSLARRLRRRRVGMDHHALGTRHRAACDRLGRFFHLDQAHAAVARDREPLVVAEMGHLDAHLLARLEYGRAGLDLDLDAVDAQRRHSVPRPLTRPRSRGAPRCAPRARGGNDGSGPAPARRRRRPARRWCGPRSGRPPR